ncbi:MAG: Gfo/Idh/MocA family oxidoreductase, partial [Candidatus Omnitrophota bacterium]
MQDLKIAVVGTGSWGKHLVRNYYELGVLYACCDVDKKKLEAAKKNYRVAKTTTDYEDIVNDPDIDAVV